MFPVGAIIVTEHSDVKFCVCVPPCQLAPVNTPPVVDVIPNEWELAGHLHVPLLQFPDTQSPFTLQLSVSAQSGHGPPQSTSVSPPFCTPSLHDAARHTKAEHTLLVQSAFTRHVSPGPQSGQVPPPQSTSVSVPFWMKSEHEGAVEVVVLVEVEVDVVDEDVDVDVDVVPSVDELVLVVVVTRVVVVPAPGQALPTPFLQTSFAPVPPPISL
jgi:hypothetical protein